MAIFWGIIGMSIGVFVASELVWPDLNNGISWLSFGRLRPLHTNIVIFGFGATALMATSFYVAQRTCQTTLAFKNLASFVFWDGNLF